MRTVFTGFLAFACLSLLAAAPAFPQAPAKKPAIKSAAAPHTPAYSGETMFNTYCATCHGKTGVGNGPAAPGLKKVPADLTQLAKNNGGKFPEQRFREVVAQNALVVEHGTSEMPMWGDVFRSMKEGDEGAKLRVFNLSNYVQGLQKK